MRSFPTGSPTEFRTTQLIASEFRMTQLIMTELRTTQHRKVLKHSQIPYYQGILKLFLILLYDHPELRKPILNVKKTIRWELERR
jgi:hypothetical protein